MHASDTALIPLHLTRQRQLEGDEAVTDEAHAVITSSSQITDTTGVLAATATGAATYAPRFEVDSVRM